MEILILKIIVFVCISIVAGILVWRDKEVIAVILMLSGLLVICSPWTL